MIIHSQSHTLLLTNVSPRRFSSPNPSFIEVCSFKKLIVWAAVSAHSHQFLLIFFCNGKAKEGGGGADLLCNKMRKDSL